MQFLRYLKLQYLKILRLQDAPDKIAKGVALGVGLDFLPLPFVSLLVAYIIAKLAKFNSMAAVMTAAILKWAVFTIFYPMNILVGKIMLGKHLSSHVEKVPIAEPGLSLEGLRNFFSPQTLDRLGSSFLVGSVFNAVVFSLITYFLLHRVLEFRYKRRKERKAKREKRRLSKPKSSE